ncbi:hypothetical protein GOP47_0023888 [Adiantum capillus-veneris]|uniref:Uncharacterized protein n=1 Tax=Adiantum capillus-veneris TaxID=13818 RepID=A0A9D4U5I8_ADICA|nr:hypothetical protein GOP47_0023888 [Adiantum capillus-veneris]
MAAPVPSLSLLRACADSGMALYLLACALMSTFDRGSNVWQACHAVPMLLDRHWIWLIIAGWLHVRTICSQVAFLLSSEAYQVRVSKQ